MSKSVNNVAASLSFGAYNEKDNTGQVAWLLEICCPIYKFKTAVQVLNVCCVQAQMEAGLLVKGSYVQACRWVAQRALLLSQSDMGILARVYARDDTNNGHSADTL